MEQKLTDEQQRVVENAKQMRGDATSYFDKVVKPRWEDNWALYIGDQHKDIPIEPPDAKIEINHCRKAVYFHIPLLTDARPTMAVHGVGAEDAEKAKFIDKFFNWKWDRLYMENRRAIAYHWACIFGLAWMHPFINMTKGFQAQGGWVKGDVDVAVPDPGNVLIDPSTNWSANPIEAMDNAEFVIYQHLVPKRRLKIAYPHLADRIDALTGATQKDITPWSKIKHLIMNAVGANEEWIPASNPVGGTVTGGSYVTKGQKQPYVYRGERPLVWHCWMRDENVKGGIRVVSMVEDLFLDEMPIPYNHGQFPFIPVVCNPIPGKVYGYGLLEIIRESQREYNRRREQIMNFLNIYNNPPIWFPLNSCKDPEKFIWKAGAKAFGETADAQAPQPLQQPTLPQDLYRLCEMCKEDMQELLGINENIMSGNLKAGSPGVAYEQVIEQALQRVRMIERWNNASFQRLGKQMLSLSQQHYGDTGYMVRVINELGQDGGRVLTADDWPAEYDLEFVPNSAYAVRQEVWFKKLMDLRATGERIPIDTLIDYSGVPNAEALKKTVAAEKAKQQQIAAQQAAAQGVPPQGGQPGGQM